MRTPLAALTAAGLVLLLTAAALLPGVCAQGAARAEDGKLRRLTVSLAPGKACHAKGARAVRTWMLGVDGVRSAAATCRRGSKLEVAVACRRGAASECTRMVRDVAVAVSRQATRTGAAARSAAPRTCASMQDLCDAYLAATSFKGCVMGDERCPGLIFNPDMVLQTAFFPATQPSWPALRAVSCNGLERMLNSGAMLQKLNFGRNLDTMAITGVMCEFSDRSTELLGLWSHCWIGQCNDPKFNDTTLAWFTEYDYLVDLGSSAVTNLGAFTSKKDTWQLCSVRVQLANGQKTSEEVNKDWCSMDSVGSKQLQSVDWSNMVDGKNTRLIDVWAMVDKDGRMYSVSLTILRFDSLEMQTLVYKNLSSQGGPLPAFNLGVMVDSTKSSVGGDITTTISFLTTQKVALSTSETVGSAITQSLSVFPKFGPVSLPEFSVEQSWTTSDATINTLTKTTDTTIETSPKLTIKPRETAALYMMMFNGTARIPFSWAGKMKYGADDFMNFDTTGALELDGSLTFNSKGVRNLSAVPGFNPSGAAADFTPTPPVPTPEYPTALPQVYSTFYFDGTGVTAVPKNISWCGDSMPHGGVKRLSVAWLPHPESIGAFLIGMRLYLADGTVACGDMGNMTLPGRTLTISDVTFQPNEVITGIVYTRNSLYEVLAQMDITTSQGRQVQIGYCMRGFIDYPNYISRFPLASGVLDGLGFMLGTWHWYGEDPYQYLTGFALVTLQPFVDMGLEIGQTAAPPVGLPSLASTYNIDSVNSQNIRIMTTSTLQYDLGNVMKDSYSFTKGLKIDKFQVPKIPIVVTPSKKWTSSTESQKSDTSTWSQKASSTISLNLFYNSSGATASSVVYVKMYDSQANIPYNGVIKIVFACGYVHRWNITGNMAAQDGSFTIIEIADRVSGAAPSGNATDGFAAATAKATADPEALARELLALPDDEPRKHKALGMYRVKPEETTWEAVCATTACDVRLAAALNGGAPPVPGTSVIVPTLG